MPNSIRECISKIESDEFAAHANLNSGISSFIGFLSSSEDVEDLRFCSGSKVVTEAIATRMTELAEIQPDYRYLHPYDVPLATYLYVLEKLDPNFAVTVRPLVSGTSNTWWASHLAGLVDADVQTSSASVEAQLGNIPNEFVEARNTGISKFIVEYSSDVGSFKKPVPSPDSAFDIRWPSDA